MNDNIVDLTKKSLDYYDNQNLLYKEYLENTDFEIKESEFIISKNDKIILKGDYQIVGLFDFQTKVWINGWAMNLWPMEGDMNQKNSLSRQLFDYVYNIKINYELNYNTYINNYINNQLCNSRILVEDNIELDIFLGLISYLLKDKIKFIYPHIKYLNNDKSRYIINYYFIL